MNIVRGGGGVENPGHVKCEERAKLWEEERMSAPHDFIWWNTFVTPGQIDYRSSLLMIELVLM